PTQTNTPERRPSKPQRSPGQTERTSTRPRRSRNGIPPCSSRSAKGRRPSRKQKRNYRPPMARKDQNLGVILRLPTRLPLDIGKSSTESDLLNWQLVPQEVPSLFSRVRPLQGRAARSIGPRTSTKAWRPRSS